MPETPLLPSDLLAEYPEMEAFVAAAEAADKAYDEYLLWESGGTAYPAFTLGVSSEGTYRVYVPGTVRDY